ncbi:MAG: hypothetical protein ACLPZJ_06995, partial [Terriglobales bacterium]
MFSLQPPRHTPTLPGRRALEMLAGSPHGCTESIMMAHSSAIGMLRDLAREGLATAASETVVAGGRRIAVTRLRITGALKSDAVAGHGPAGHYLHRGRAPRWRVPCRPRADR